MRVLVTGAAGFIGSHVADRLVANGHDVIGIDNFLTGFRGSFPEEGRLLAGRVEYAADVINGYRPDVIFHAAASYNDPAAWARDIRTNVEGTAVVAQAARAANVERIVYCQTSLCYGLTPPPYPMGEDHPLDPRGSYAVSKTAGEQYLLESGLDVVSFRLANVYGPRNLSGPVPAFWKRLTAGEACTVVDARRDFVYVSDAVDVFEQALLGDGEPGVYHVATGGDYAIAELYAQVASRFDDAAATVQPRGDDDVATILLNPGKAAAAFDWQATTPLDVGIALACAWYEEHGVGETFTHLRIKEPV